MHCPSSCSVFSSLHLHRLALAALVWCVALAASLQAAVAQRNAPPGQVRVGVILDLASTIGQRRKVGIEMAVEDYYAAHPTSRTRVALRFRDSSWDVVGAASAALDLIKNEQVQAIIGPPSSAEAGFVASLGTSTHVPILSFSATSPGLSPAQTRFFVRTAANDSYQTAPVAAVLAAFRWHAAAVVYEDSPYGSGILPALADALQGVGTRIMERAAVPIDADDDRIDKVLYQYMAMPTRVFVVHMNYPLAARFFRRARSAGMMSEDYAWIVTDGVGSYVDAMSPDDINAMEGVVSLRPYVQMTDEVKNFSARFRARLRRENPSADIYVHDPTVFMLWSYDTAWAIAAAAEEAGVSSPAFQTPQKSTALTGLDRLGVSAIGATLLKAVHGTTFHGLAGKFTLVDGQLQPPAYEVVNVIEKGARPVGFWTPESGISTALDGNGAKKLKTIIWPGDSSPSPPKGWVVSANGQKLRVAVPVKRGFKEFVNVANDSTNGPPNVTGYCIEVFDAVMRNMPYPVTYEYVPFPNSYESYDKFVPLLQEQKADIVVGDVTIRASRMFKVDFSMPFTDSGWSMVAAVRTETSTSMWIFLQPLTTSLWLASLAFFCFTGFVVWAIEHRINPEFRGTPWQQFGLIFYFAFSTLVFSHKEKLESNLSRFVVIIWVFVVLILTSSYTASLTSMLTVQKLQPTVTDVRELQRSGAYIGYQEGTFIKDSLRKIGFDEAKMRPYSTAEGYADALSKGPANGGVAAVFDEIPYLKLFLSQYCDGYTMVGPVYKTDGFGFVFPLGSPLTPDVSRAVLTLAESDEMAQIEKKWFGEPGACPSQGGSAAVGSANLSFQSFGGLFLITGVVSGLMLLIYLASFVYRERGEVRNVEEGGSGSASSSVRRLRAWLRHFDQKDLKCPTFKTWNEESVREGSQTRRWVDDTVRNGRGASSAVQPVSEEASGMSPFGISTGGSEMINAGSSPASELGTSFEQRMQEAPHSAETLYSVEMIRSTA
ncbi:Glutamate receptor 2.8 [Dichanthelium oligosanthes]|uniref:Glutamate receptor 2.8 n=1 Tax=Dichanthelium oligosanthes TaxID=888268 RepID=A0A1E5VHR7_9POAL|nr:Glutamate receptor 2.8 [Dichanthelium oligosanthes]